MAGQFYPADPDALRAEVVSALRFAAPETPAPAAAVVVPHAGYVYSGRVAGATYASAALPATLVILCPNHTGRGRRIAVMNRGVWRTPLGLAKIDEGLADLILTTCATAEPDETAHRREHSLEVQLPFLQVIMDGTFSFVPICIGASDLGVLLELGAGLARAIRDWPQAAAILISSDMSHYVSAQEARSKDAMAIERIIHVDPEALHQVVREEQISMCGVAPAVAGLAAARLGGATEGRLVAYANSGDVSGDNESVVGYAGLAIA